MEAKKSFVNIWEEDVIIPTYGIGAPDKNPMFFEKRVYQGSQGKVYPFPVIDQIYDEVEDCSYRAVYLENEYLKIMVLPQLGGRIQRAFDKTNNYDFVYYNEVIKPALVGLTGPWISGGIEFNWPQHHRPSTFMPLQYKLEQADGRVSVIINEVDRMYGTKGMMTITLRPGKAYIEIRGQLFNPTPLPQTFLWWANPAVEAHEETQSIFPPDVHYVMDHGKRDMSSFPIAAGTYYKYNYAPGTDISRYINIPVPTSFMAYKSEFDFVGGYDYRKAAGIMHIADHHVSPGKKQWTWGNGDFGRAWDRNLTDRNGPYVELMTGVFTDNQPDFTWLMPGEEKRFTQYFLPYKGVGQVANANQDFVLGVQTAKGNARISIYASSRHNDLIVRLTSKGKLLYETIFNITPENAFIQEVPLEDESSLPVLSIIGDDNQILLQTIEQPTNHEVAVPATALPAPEEIDTVEELYLAGQHLEQYRHATRNPIPYYLEGLKRDSKHVGCNVAYGNLLLRRGLFEQSEQYFRKAQQRLTWKNPNPQNGSASFGLGLSLYYQYRYEEAYDAFYKATWSAAEQTQAFYYLASTKARQGKWSEAVQHGKDSLIHNFHNMKSRGLTALCLHRMGKVDDAITLATETLELDPFTHVCRLLIPSEANQVYREDMRTIIGIAIDLVEAGCADMAVDLLAHVDIREPMPAYYYAWARKQASLPYKSALDLARHTPLDYAFPNLIEDQQVLSFALMEDPRDGSAAYCLGNLLYDKQRYDEAAAYWSIAASELTKFATPLRNLAIYTYNKLGQPQNALSLMQQAYDRNPSDARVLMELDQLRKRNGCLPIDRLEALKANMQLVYTRDDLLCEYVTLLNLTGSHLDALDITLGHNFHPWEGGEGKITHQYAIALRELAEEALRNDDAEHAVELLKQALKYPENLGEGKLIGEKDNDLYYLLGNCAEALGNMAEARIAWLKATEADGQLSVAHYYNDQPAELFFYVGLAHEKLGNKSKATSVYRELITYGESHLNDQPQLDYFAVSLPDMQVFDMDLLKSNRVHCLYLMALGYLGLGNSQKAISHLENVIALDPAHSNAALVLKKVKKEGCELS